MSMSDAAETALANLLFKNIAWANFGDVSGLQPSATAGNLYVRLHSDDPGEGGTGDTNEISYTGYLPVEIVRGAGFTVTGDTVSNTALTVFGKRTNSGTVTATHFSICLGSGAGAMILVSGALVDPVDISLNIQPEFAIGALTTTIN